MVLAPSRLRPSLARRPTSAIKNGAPSSVKAPSTMVLTARLRPSFHSKGGYAGLLVNDSVLEGNELVLWLTAGRPPTPPSDLHDVRNFWVFDPEKIKSEYSLCSYHHIPTSVRKTSVGGVTFFGHRDQTPQQECREAVLINATAHATEECEGAPCDQSYTAGKEIGDQPTWHEPNLVTQSQLKTVPSSPPHCFTRSVLHARCTAGSGASTIILGMHMSDELVDWFNQDGHFAALRRRQLPCGGGAVKTIDDVGRRANEGRNRDGAKTVDGAVLTLDDAPLLMEMSAVIRDLVE
ncbi:hypothetical protein B0H14DRAFT_2620978 [Mycena olivaceomarginata]|nr:hypothetical protein B0H14DRAFT_2620978 [Mycena olivaceomarginata]